MTICANRDTPPHMASAMMLECVDGPALAEVEAKENEEGGTKAQSSGKRC